MKGKKRYFPALRDDYNAIWLFSVARVNDVTREAWRSYDAWHQILYQNNVSKTATRTRWVDATLSGLLALHPRVHQQSPGLRNIGYRVYKVKTTGGRPEL